MAVPAGGVNDLRAVFEQPQAEALVVRRDGEAIGVRQMAYRVQGAAEAPTLRAPPHYGEHTLEVLTQDAELSRAEADALVEAGVAAVGS